MDRIGPPSARGANSPPPIVPRDTVFASGTTANDGTHRAYSPRMTNPATDTETPSPATDVQPEARHVNSVDASAGQPMVARVMERKVELEALLVGLDPQDSGTRADIEAALALITQMLSGDLTAVPAVVMVDMNRWLERTKHLGERSAPMAPAVEIAAPEVETAVEPTPS